MDFVSQAESDAAIEQMRTSKLILVDKQIHHMYIREEKIKGLLQTSSVK